MAYIENVPFEILDLIMDYIDFFDLQSLSLTNKKLNLASNLKGIKIKNVCDKVANVFLKDERVISFKRQTPRYLSLIQYSTTEYKNLEHPNILPYKIDLLTMIKVFGNTKCPTNYLLKKIPLQKVLEHAEN